MCHSFVCVKASVEYCHIPAPQAQCVRGQPDTSTHFTVKDGQQRHCYTLPFSPHCQSLPLHTPHAHTHTHTHTHTHIHRTPLSPTLKWLRQGDHFVVLESHSRMLAYAEYWQNAPPPMSFISSLYSIGAAVLSILFYCSESHRRDHPIFTDPNPLCYFRQDRAKWQFLFLTSCLLSAYTFYPSLCSWFLCCSLLSNHIIFFLSQFSLSILPAILIVPSPSLPTSHPPLPKYGIIQKLCSVFHQLSWQYDTPEENITHGCHPFSVSMEALLNIISWKTCIGLSGCYTLCMDALV